MTDRVEREEMTNEQIKAAYAETNAEYSGVPYSTFSAMMRAPDEIPPAKELAHRVKDATANMRCARIVRGLLESQR